MAKDQLELCVTPNEQIIGILQSKKNFKSLIDLQNLARNLFNAESKFENRKDIEKDIAIKMILKNLNVSILNPYIIQTKPKPSKPSKTKKQLKVASEQITIEDQTKRWLNMNIEDLTAELNDIIKYPDYKYLKAAAKSILTSAEKTKRSREYYIELIIEKISNQQSLMRLGS